MNISLYHANIYPVFLQKSDFILILTHFPYHKGKLFGNLPTICPLSTDVYTMRQVHYGIVPIDTHQFAIDTIHRYRIIIGSYVVMNGIGHGIASL